MHAIHDRQEKPWLQLSMQQLRNLLLSFFPSPSSNDLDRWLVVQPREPSGRCGGGHGRAARFVVASRGDHVLRAPAGNEIANQTTCEPAPAYALCTNNNSNQCIHLYLEQV